MGAVIEDVQAARKLGQGAAKPMQRDTKSYAKRTMKVVQ
jgi:hypothetical protein